MKLIVGLGNPGPEYADTRHNVGFRVVEALAERVGIALDDHAGEVVLGEGQLEGRDVVLAKPLTYVNRSSLAVRQLLRRYDIEPKALLVIMDDLHLPVGSIRLRPGGSAGGHNGLQDIIDRLGTDRIPRLRLGIGSDFRQGEQAAYVLSSFTREQRPLIEDAIAQSCRAVETFVEEDVQTAMNRFN